MTSTFPVRPSRRSSLNKSLLIVEDNDDQWQLIQAALNKVLPQIWAVRVTTCDQAYDYMLACLHDEASAPSFILLDLYLPTPALGWQTLSRIKEIGAPINQIPVLMLSNSGVTDDITESYRRGALAYLIKPVTYPDWLELVKHIHDYWFATVALPSFRSVF